MCFLLYKSGNSYNEPRTAALTPKILQNQRRASYCRISLSLSLCHCDHFVSHEIRAPINIKIPNPIPYHSPFRFEMRYRTQTSRHAGWESKPKVKLPSPSTGRRGGVSVNPSATVAVLNKCRKITSFRTLCTLVSNEVCRIFIAL